ncbi:MAG: RrF2 family transcriptional regulator [Acidimicrobiia bacterium]
MRLELTKKTDLAFQALAAVAAASDSRVNGAALAQSLEISTQYLPHVMAPLTRAGWVKSVSGPHGGYTLAVSLGSVSLLDLVVAVEGPVDESRCLHQGPMHTDDSTCRLHGPWTRARAALLGELADTPLEEMLVAAAR